MNKYNLFCLGDFRLSSNKLKKEITAENTQEAYKEFILTYKEELKQILILNDCALLCWTKKNPLYTDSGQRELIKFKRFLK